MTHKPDVSAPESVADATSLKTWQSPRIEDADISTLTAGAGTSGIEGTPFLKTGS